MNEKPVIIAVNNIIVDYKTDYIFFSGIKRYEFIEQKHDEIKSKLIITSNIKQEGEEKEYIINYLSLIKYGWVNIDNSAILLLRLLVSLNVKSIYIAGLDGFIFSGKDNFYRDELSSEEIDYEGLQLLNKEMRGMLSDIRSECEQNHICFKLITRSLYDDVWEDDNV